LLSLSLHYICIRLTRYYISCLAVTVPLLCFLGQKQHVAFFHSSLCDIKVLLYSQRSSSYLWTDKSGWVKLMFFELAGTLLGIATNALLRKVESRSQKENVMTFIFMTSVN